MGNQNKKIVLQSAERMIVIDEKHGKTMWLNELPVFPHGYDGLHIWEAGIVLSRHVLENKDQFAGRTVLELGSGVGIGGLSVAKFTECKKVVLSDYVAEIVDNIKGNASKNKVSDKVEIIKLNWLEHEKFNMQFDIVIGSDIVYFGCPVAELYKLIKKVLVEGGIAQIIIPDRKSYAELFLQQIEPHQFEVYKKKLEDPMYRQSPLPNKVEGLKEYNLLVDIDFYVYTLVKRTRSPQEMIHQRQRQNNEEVQIQKHQVQVESNQEQKQEELKQHEQKDNESKALENTEPVQEEIIHTIQNQEIRQETKRSHEEIQQKSEQIVTQPVTNQQHAEQKNQAENVGQNQISNVESNNLKESVTEDKNLNNQQQEFNQFQQQASYVQKDQHQSVEKQQQKVDIVKDENVQIDNTDNQQIQEPQKVEVVNISNPIGNIIETIQQKEEQKQQVESLDEDKQQNKEEQISNQNKQTSKTEDFESEKISNDQSVSEQETKAQVSKSEQNHAQISRQNQTNEEQQNAGEANQEVNKQGKNESKKKKKKRNKNKKENEKQTDNQQKEQEDQKS